MESALWHLRYIILAAVIASIMTANGLPANDNRPDESDSSSSEQCNCVCGSRGRANRIVGGQVTLPHEFPWIAGLYRQGKVYCGASLISNRHVLTAAHCLYGFEPSEIRVLLGGHNITRDFTEIKRVARFIEHKKFNILNFNNDIAIVELDEPVKFTPSIQPACLPDADKKDYDGSLAIIAGWGRTEEKAKPSEILRSVIVPIWGQTSCKEAGYGSEKISENMMCAGYHDGVRDACQGDSGGPMHMEGATGSMEIVGIVSWGRGCARPNLPGIYTRVVNYLPWIQKHLKKECLCEPRAGERTNFVEKFFATLTPLH